MGLDVRLPMGTMFSILGVILTLFGFFSDRKKYDEHSLGININLWWGLCILAFGVVMLLLAMRAKGKATAAPTPEAE